MAYVSVSCSDEMYVPTDDNMPTTGHYFVLANTETAASTRVAYDASDYNKSTFEEGDKVGVFVMDASGNAVKTNIPYTVKSSTEMINGKTYQYLEPVSTSNQAPESEEYTYAFVYPYNANMTLSDLKSYSHSVEADQSSESATSNDNFEKSDLLWDVVQGSATQVNIDMDHAMAQIIVVVDNEISDVKLCQTAKTSISGLELSKRLEDWRNDGTSASVDGNSKSYITMWSHSDYQNSESGKRVYRCVVPAQTFAKGAFLSFNRNGSAKTSSLSEALTVQTGKNYLFMVNKHTDPLTPDDDESWVLDVVDPVTGEIVGLLCREYLRYQPTQTEDVHTGTEGTNSDGTTTKWINSQAWVFYNFQNKTTKIPDLSKGTVMKFIYDFEEYKDRTVLWPYDEGYDYWQKGIMSPIHGATWASGESAYNVYSTAETGGREKYYLNDASMKPIITEYYMHGGVIYWDGSNNVISKFTLPSEQITCAQAEYGHIAIDGDNIYVSYNETEKQGVRTGVLVPHYLVDRRVNSDGVTEVNKYPLVKIGFNQFWMSKSLNAKTMTDGTSLTCYNKTGEPGVTFSSTDVLSNAGYLYPYATNVENDANQKVNYDPYNNEKEMHPTTVNPYQKSNTKYSVVPMYNRNAVNTANFLPEATDDSRLTYIMPQKTQFDELKQYFGPNFGAKLMTRDISTRKSQWNDQFYYSMYNSMLWGELRQNYGSSTANNYCANVSGFNWRATGYYEPSAGYVTNITGDCYLMLKASNENNVSYFTFRCYNVFGDTYDQYFYDGDYGSYYQSYDKASQVFAQVRFVMQFKNQSSTSSAKTRASEDTVASSKPQQPSNTVYVRLTEK